MMLLCCLGLPTLSAQPALRTEFQDLPPKAFLDGDGVLRGVSVEAIGLIRRRTGLAISSPEFPVPVKRVENDLISGAIDLQAGFIKTPERLKRLTFGEKICDITFVALVRPDDPADFRTLAEIAAEGGAVLTLRGTAAEELLAGVGGLDVDAGAATVEANVRKLQEGRGRLLVYYDLAIGWAFRTGLIPPGFKVVRLDFAGLPHLAEASQYMAYSDSLPQELRGEIDEALRALRASGELEAALAPFRVPAEAFAPAPPLDKGSGSGAR